jgi:hypothetical protein
MFRKEAKFLGWIWLSFILRGLLAALIIPNFVRPRERKPLPDNAQRANEVETEKSSVHP